MTLRFRRVLALVLLAGLASGCRLFEPSTAFFLKMELGPKEDRPKTWDYVKHLGMRRVPSVGDAAPDFTVTTMDGTTAITRSDFQAGRPLVLILASFS
ncbi:MAG: peroxiredoxin family protein [Planctomycetes bacterium]|nr:peroxiredoxin family protein [Planctomycetota bacterium]